MTSCHTVDEQVHQPTFCDDVLPAMLQACSHADALNDDCYCVIPWFIFAWGAASWALQLGNLNLVVEHCMCHNITIAPTNGECSGGAQDTVVAEIRGPVRNDDGKAMLLWLLVLMAVPVHGLAHHQCTCAKPGVHCLSMRVSMATRC